MARWAWNRASMETKRRYFELIRQGLSGAAAARAVGVSLSCGSVWFVDAGSVKFIDTPISRRYLNQDESKSLMGWPPANRSSRSRSESGKAFRVSIGNSPDIDAPTADISRGRHTDRPGKPVGAIGRGDSTRVRACARPSRRSCQRNGRRSRSVAGYAAATRVGASGTSAPKRSTTPSTAVVSCRRMPRLCAPAGLTDTATAAAGHATARSNNPLQ